MLPAAAGYHAMSAMPLTHSSVLETDRPLHVVVDPVCGV